MDSVSKEFSISKILSEFDRCVEETRVSVLGSSFVFSATKKYRGHDIQVELGFIVEGEPKDDDDFFWHCPHYIVEVPSFGIRDEDEPGHCETWAGDGLFIAREVRRKIAAMLRSVRREFGWPRIRALLEQEMLGSEIPDPAAFSSNSQRI